MALKDWKKSKGDRWFSESRGEYREIEILKTKKGHSVFIGNKSPKGWTFKKKSNALKKAKAYMKKH